MHVTMEDSQEQQLPVITDYAGKPLSFTSLLPTMTAAQSPTLNKYWSQRYRLFSRYDRGVRMDSGEKSYLNKLCVYMYIPFSGFAMDCLRGSPLVVVVVGR